MCNSTGCGERFFRPREIYFATIPRSDKLDGSSAELCAVFNGVLLGGSYFTVPGEEEAGFGSL